MGLNPKKDTSYFKFECMVKVYTYIFGFMNVYQLLYRKHYQESILYSFFVKLTPLKSFIRKLAWIYGMCSLLRGPCLGEEEELEEKVEKNAKNKLEFLHKNKEIYFHFFLAFILTFV